MKRSLLITASIALLMLTALAVRLFLHTETRRSLELARVMPGGALAYAEFRDLDSLLSQWRASAAHKRYLESANWKQFQNSRLYLRLLQRLEPIEAALGFELTEQRLSALAGKQSAFGVYNIAQLEALFVTVMPQPEAFATVLFKQRRAFRERTMEGRVYYVRQGTGAESQEKGEAGFAFAQGKLFVASSEVLLRRALANLTRDSEDRLSAQIARLTDGLNDFQPHDITAWLDQRRLNADRYFRNYWIHHNQSALADMETALIDLEMTETEWRERRWFALSETASKEQPSINSLDELLRLAPADTHLITVASPKDVKTLSRQLADLILGVAPSSRTSFSTGPMFYSGEEYPYEPSSPGGAWRYASLDERFNKDIDDPTSFAQPASSRGEPPEASPESEERFITQLTDILQPAEPLEFMHMAEAMRGENQLFVYFNRALIVRLKRPTAFNSRAFEEAVREQFAAQYVVQGVPTRLEWEASGGVHSLSQAILDRSGAYALLGDYLILANRADYGRRVAQAHRASTTSTQIQPASLQRYAQVRVQKGKGAYKHVMEMFATPDATMGSNEAIDLFSDNIASLIEVVPELSSITIETVHAAPFVREVAIYKFTIR